MDCRQRAVYDPQLPERKQELRQPMISQKTPEDLNRIFYTICGSTAVETAIKIAVAYFRSINQANRFKFVGRERGYHGMNIGALTVGGIPNNSIEFKNILMPGV